MLKKKYTTFLYLESGDYYQGWSFISDLVSYGEVVFNTGMTGYQEVITDPSYYKQIVLFTYPEIGNTGTNLLDIESDHSYIRGLIAKNICGKSSNWRSDYSFLDYLLLKNIPHVFGIDTRSLAKKLRKQGVMISCISTKMLDQESLKLSMQSFKISLQCDISNIITTRKQYSWSPRLLDHVNYIFDKKCNSNSAGLKVVVIDYGLKFNILNRLIYYGCSVIVVPADISYRRMVNLKPDGILLSNGPGDPALISENVLRNIESFVSLNIPVFGICLGHQLLSLSIGAETIKLKFGHRGINHPSGSSNSVKITSQNHGYVVSSSTTFSYSLGIGCLNCNDKTISGVLHKDKPCFSVQYHPEASPGPHDSDFLFPYFVQIMRFCKFIES